MSASSLKAHQQAHYLDAMGLTLWVPRYRLPNALESEECAWPEASSASPRGHSERIQDMLKEAEQPRPSASSAQQDATAAPATSDLSHAARPDLRELLGQSPLAHHHDKASATDQVRIPPPSASDTSAARPTATPSEGSQASSTVAASSDAGKPPLRFSFDSMVIGNRWLVMSVGEYFDAQATSLVDAILATTGLGQRAPSLHVDFSWPIVEGFLADDPVAEAGEGVRAFAEGRQFAGAELQAVLLFADREDDRSVPLIDVLKVTNNHSELLEMPVVVAPSLSELYADAGAKRSLWQALHKVKAG